MKEDTHLTDDKYTLVETNKERAALARSSRHRKAGSRSRKVPMRTDYMTPTQLRKENGPVMTYNMNAPITMRDLRTWPIDLQREYMRRIDERFHVPGPYIADMLKVTAATLSRYRTSIGVPAGDKRPKPSAEVQALWDAFIGGERAQEEVSVVDGHSEDAPAPEPSPVQDNAGVFRGATLALEGSVEECVAWLMRSLRDKADAQRRVSITVRFEKVG